MRLMKKKNVETSEGHESVLVVVFNNDQRTIYECQTHRPLISGLYLIMTGDCHFRYWLPLASNRIDTNRNGSFLSELILQIFSFNLVLL